MLEELRGIGASLGIAIGKAYHYTPFVPEVKNIQIDASEVENALNKYETARSLASSELDVLCKHFENESPDKAQIFVAHKDILNDIAMEEEIRELINSESYSPDWAVEQVFDMYAKILGNSKDAVIRERAADINDVKTRLLRCFTGEPEKNLSSLNEPVIVIAHDLSPSDTAMLDRDMVLAFISERGGATSHCAIIARSYRIPALLGLAGAMSSIPQGTEIIVDARQGVALTGYDDKTRAHYEQQRVEYIRKRDETDRFFDVTPQTIDGTRIRVDLNISLADAMEMDGAKHVDGVGLFRTEYLYMGRQSLPDEEEQLLEYRKVLLTFGDRPVIIRTIDIGGDKKLPGLNLPVEENPFLGVRGLRLCFMMEELFRTQLRALLRASVHGNLWIMFPMVANIEDIRRVKDIVSDVKRGLDMQGIAYSNDCKTGIMIEVPSVAVIADIVANEVDFASIGTNDLMQYTFAADRMNSGVAEYCDSLSPALLRLIGQAAAAFKAANKPLGVCGEMGGNPLSAALLMGLGIRKLSMGLSSVAEVKKCIVEADINNLTALAEKACKLSTAGEVGELLKEGLASL